MRRKYSALLRLAPSGIALRSPCFAQALGGHRGHPFDAVRLTRVRGVQVGFLPT